jgi:hypothetical protein
MPSSQPNRPRAVLLSARFLGPAAVGVIVTLFAAMFAPGSVLIAVVGAAVSILAGLLYGHLVKAAGQRRSEIDAMRRLAGLLTIGSEQQIYSHDQAILRNLTDLARQSDPLLRQIVTWKLAAIETEVARLASCRLIFTGDEPWRTLYDALLANPDLDVFQSVAWVRSKEYWQDEPARRSMRKIFETAHRGVLVERIIILPEILWPTEHHFPSDDIYPWIEEQHDHGLWVVLVRESKLSANPDLITETAIFREIAVGTSDLDTKGRTLRFTLQSDRESIRLAFDRWQQLSVLGISTRELLDQAERAG